MTETNEEEQSLGKSSITEESWKGQGSNNAVKRFVVWDRKGGFIAARPTFEEAEVILLHMQRNYEDIDND